MLVGDVEDDKLPRERVCAAGGQQLVLARLERGERRRQVGRLVGHGRERLLHALHAVGHLAAHVLAGCVDQIESDGLQLVLAYALGQVDGEDGLFLAHGYGCDALLRLARRTGHVCCHVEAEDAVGRDLCVVLVLQDEGDADGEVALVVGGAGVAGDTGVVVAVAPPAPPHQPPFDGVAHLGTHYRHTGKRAHVSLHGHGVARLVGFGEFVKLHLKGGTLVFLHLEIAASAHGLDGVVAREPRLRQHELCLCRSVFVGGRLHLLDSLPVGVAQREGDFLPAHSLVDDMVGMLREDGGHMHRLARTVDAAVGEEVGLRVVAVVVRIAVIVVRPQEQ